MYMYVTVLCLQAIPILSASFYLYLFELWMGPIIGTLFVKGNVNKCFKTKFCPMFFFLLLNNCSINKRQPVSAQVSCENLWHAI